MRIIIDGRPLIKPLTGVGNVLLCFLKELEKYKDIELYILLPQEIDKSISIKETNNIHLIICPLWGIKNIPRALWFLVKVPIMLRKIKADLLFSAITSIPFFIPSNIKTLIIVHDVVNLEYTQTMTWKNYLFNKLVFKRGIEKTDFLWANSQYTKNKIKEYFPKRKSKDIFVGCSVDRNIFYKINLTNQQKEELRHKYNISNKFILFVGSLEPRKNLSFLLKLMPQLSEYNIQLLVVGGNGWKNSDLKEVIETSEAIKKATIFTGYINNEELVKLYNIADCYVSTSINEGFGMPQLEAMLCGCPVVTSHNSAMIEVVGDKGITVKGWDKDTWIKAILKGVNEPHKQYDLKEYDWEIITSKLLKSINYHQRDL